MHVIGNQLAVYAEKGNDAVMKVNFLAYFKRQSELFQQNKREIAKNNLELLHGVLVCGCLVFGLLFIASMFLPCYENIPLIYCCMFCMMFILLIAFRFSWIQHFAAGGFYLVSAMLFLLAAYIGLRIDVQQKTTVLIGLYCLAPLVILDKSWRINTAVLASYLVYTMLAFLLKEHQAALDDSLNSACFAISGIFVGEYMRFIRLDNIELKRRAQLKMKTDFLTGLFNRRKLYEVIQNEKKAGTRKINAVMMLDIDHFKRYNDCYGHPAGDICLQKIGVLLKEYEKDERAETFRYGGEEFVVLMDIMDVNEMHDIAEMLRRKVWELEIAFPQYREGRLTLSIGFAVRGEEGKDTPEQLIAKADKALYGAKSGGRNRVCCYSAQSELSTQR